MVEHVSDFKMPEKIVTRLLKDALPEDVTVSKEAKNVACRSASVFILHLSIIAAEKASLNRRRTLDNKDIISAAAELGLSEYTPQLVRFGAQRKRNAKRKETNIQRSRNKRASANNAELQVSQNHSNDADLNSVISNANFSENQDDEMAQVDNAPDRVEADTDSSADEDGQIEDEQTTTSN